MFEPKGYKSTWQKFENDVYFVTKKLLGDTFVVKWNGIVGEGLTPDVVVSKSWIDDMGPGDVPFLIIEAHHNLQPDNEEVNREKDKQMIKYAQVCDAILVTPSGYANRPFVVRSEGTYRILSFNVLPLFLRCLKSLEITTEEDVTGRVPVFNLKPVYDRFELELRKSIDRCPSCKAESFPISLIYCSHWDLNFHMDYFDQEVIDHKAIVKTYSECDGCDWHDHYDYNYEECPFASVSYKYQCKECGAIFEPDSSSFVTNFVESHLDELVAGFDFYTKWERSKGAY